MITFLIIIQIIESQKRNTEITSTAIMIYLYLLNMESGSTSRGDDGNALLEYHGFKEGDHSNQRPPPDDPPSCPRNPAPPFQFSAHCMCDNCMTAWGHGGNYKRRL